MNFREDYNIHYIPNKQNILLRFKSVQCFIHIVAIR